MYLYYHSAMYEKEPTGLKHVATAGGHIHLGKGRAYRDFIQPLITVRYYRNID